MQAFEEGKPTMRLRYAWFASALFLMLLVSSAEPVEPTGYERELRSYNLARGRKVFTNNCMECHESGTKGAPVFGNIDDWGPRIQQPLTVLIEHASRGQDDMPSNCDSGLLDSEVAAAVAYVVHHSRLLAGDVNSLSATGAGPRPVAALCGPGNSGLDCATVTVSDDAFVNMLLMVLGKDRWK